LRDDELQPDQEWVASSSETVVVEANGSVIDEILGFHVEALEKSPTTPPSYTLIFDFAGSKHRVIFSNIKELSTQAQFLVKIMEELDIFIPRLKKSKWEEAMSLLLPMAQTIEMIDGSSESQEIRIKLNMFLEARGSMLVDNDIDAPDDCFARHITTVDPRFMPYGLGDLIILINPRAFMTWHNREGFPERLSIQQTSVAFSRIRHKLVKFKGKQWVMFKGEDMGEGRIEIP
jgi:hypothetical protein